MIQSVAPPDVRWSLATAAILVAGTQLALVRKYLAEGVAVYGRDRAERSTDAANFWTIVCLFSGVACLFGAVGGFITFTLLRDQAVPGLPVFISVTWAVLIWRGERATWQEYRGGVETRFQRLMRMIYATAVLLLIIALLAIFCGGVALQYVSESAARTHQLNTAIDDHGTRYVSAQAARAFKALRLFWLITPLPAFALGYSAWLQRLRTKRLQQS